VVQQFLENLFGPRVAAEVFQDQRKRFSLDAEFENKLLAQNFAVPVNPQDEDQQHMQVHQQLMQEGDPSGHVRQHIMLHQVQMQKKQQMMAMQAMAQAMQGQGPPGGQGGPRRGAVPGPPRGGQQPPGAIHQDQMRDPGMMPRPRIGGV